MKKNWQQVKWIFKSDGALRDIYVQDVDQSDYRKLINLLNSEYKIKFGEKNSPQIDFSYIQRMWTDESDELGSTSLTIDLGGVLIKSHFFIPEQIEFDLAPRQINQLSDLNLIIDFMSAISKTIKKQVTLTNENNAVFPLIKIDFLKGIEIVLSEKEMIQISKAAGIYPHWFTRIKNVLFPKKLTAEDFEYEAMKSAFAQFEPTPIEENIW